MIMRRPELGLTILTTMLDSQPEVSDLLFTVDKPLQVEVVRRIEAGHAGSADREADALSDRDDRAEPDRRQPVA